MSAIKMAAILFSSFGQFGFILAHWISWLYSIDIAPVTGVIAHVRTMSKINPELA